jgi:hypothetical protein
MKYVPHRGKMHIKKWVFRGKMGVFGLEKIGLPTKLERLDGAKCRFNSQK